MGRIGDIALLAAVAGAGLLIWQYFSNKATPPVGGSLLDKAADATIGQIIGAPSRNGSTGTSGWLGDLRAWELDIFNSLTGGKFINDIKDKGSGSASNGVSVGNVADTSPQPALVAVGGQPVISVGGSSYTNPFSSTFYGKPATPLPTGAIPGVNFSLAPVFNAAAASTPAAVSVGGRVSVQSSALANASLPSGWSIDARGLFRPPAK